MAEKDGKLLTDIEGFPAEVAAGLSRLWITTADELVAAATGDGRQDLARYLGVPASQLDAWVDQVDEFALAVRQPIPRDPIGLGALDEEEGLGPEDEPPSEGRPLLRPSASLVARMPPVRNQQGRGTCVAHACAAVREYLLGESGSGGDLSEQFLYWACKQRDNYPGEGTYIKVAVDVLRDLGVCTESAWAYNPNKIQGNEGQGPPPDGAEAAAAPYRIGKGEAVQARWVDALKEALAAGKPVAFAVPVYSYWMAQPVRKTGDIRLPVPGEETIGGHAMCLVGYQDDTDVPGGGYFMVRNSWGTAWASDSKIAPGYCRLPYEYIAQYGRTAYTAITREAEPTTPKPQPGSTTALIDWLRKYFKTPPKGKDGGPASRSTPGSIGGREASGVPSLEQVLLAEADRQQVIAFNPQAALQKRIFADGFVPTSPEFEVEFEGAHYLAQRAEQLTTGQTRVYYVRSGLWNEVGFRGTGPIPSVRYI